VAAPDSTDYIDVVTNISVGSCDVSFLTPNPLVLPDVQKSDLEGGNILNNTKVQVKVDGCMGMGERGQKPNMTVTGSTLGASGDDVWLFSSGAGAGLSGGVGIVLGTASLPGVWDASKLIKDSDVIPLTDPGSAAYSGETKDFYVGVGCGSASTCPLNASSITAGDLSADITFAFSYK